MNRFIWLIMFLIIVSVTSGCATVTGYDEILHSDTVELRPAQQASVSEKNDTLKIYVSDIKLANTEIVDRDFIKKRSSQPVSILGVDTSSMDYKAKSPEIMVVENSVNKEPKRYKSLIKWFSRFLGLSKPSLLEEVKEKKFSDQIIESKGVPSLIPYASSFGSKLAKPVKEIDTGSQWSLKVIRAATSQGQNQSEESNREKTGILKRKY